MRRVASKSEAAPAKRPPPAKRPAMPAALSPVIRRRLRALASRALRVAWTEGLLRLVAAASLLAMVQGTADWLFDLPVRVRALFLLADAAVLVFLSARHGVRPWRRRLSPDEAALVAERRWPEFRSLLISAVQLAREPNGSPAIVAAHQRQAAEHASRVDLRQAIAWRRLRTLAVVAFALLAAVALLVWRTAPVASVLARRALLANVPLPTRTVVVAVSQNLTVAPGESVELSARAQGEIPRHGRVEVTYAGKSPESLAVTPKPASPEAFALTVPNVQGAFTYRFYLGDGRGLEWQVSLIHRPVVRSVGFRAIYPAYTGLPEAPVAAGNLRLLAGSRLQIHGNADVALQSARIIVRNGEQSSPKNLETGGGDGTGFHGELPVPAQRLTGFSVALTNKDGVTSQNDTLYAVEIVPDAPPEITLAADQPEKATLVPEDRPRLRFEVRDDFLIERVSLCVEPSDALGEGESPDPNKAKRVPIEIKKSAAALAFDFRWTDPEKTVKWQEGNTFYYWIEATDNNNVTGPGVTRTAVREWSVVSLKTKRDELTDSLRRSADSIENLSQSQEELRARVGALIQQGSEAKKP